MTEFIDHPFEWKAAIALNSLAIKMIKGSCYQQAAETIHDAMHVFEMVSSSQRPRQHDDEIVQTLENDNRRIFNPEQVSPVPVPVSIKVIQHEDVAEGVFQANAAPDGYSVIKIEYGDILPQEAFAIFLYNSAVCLLCQAKNAPQDIALYQSQTREAGLLLQQSIGILNVIYNSSQCPFVIQRILYLMRINCDVLSQTMESLGLVQQAASLRTTLLDGLDAAAEALTTSGLFANIKAASPAA
jgi:hypothetical protein